MKITVQETMSGLSYSAKALDVDIEGYRVHTENPFFTLDLSVGGNEVTYFFDSLVEIERVIEHMRLAVASARTDAKANGWVEA